MRRPRTFLSSLTVVAMLGCGSGDSEPKAIVRGTVDFDGKPLEQGIIYLSPLADTKGPANSAPIVNGKYEIRARGGVTVGKHRVRIVGYHPGSERRDDGTLHVAGPKPDAQFIPAAYNSESQLELEVPAGSKEIVRDFSLTPVTQPVSFRRRAS